ncbi:unnamed protein product [Paramecium sonneborni]|uniref:Uncharacterized protein n=1 Tax=Paramecium sonneborni TaxID=65129 RepID=A0A8S1MHX6_9CILI|nr:unnamed protein product [Paramecium sonneborni]
MTTYLPFHNLAYCPKQIIEFVQRPDINLIDLHKMLETLKLPRNHSKILRKMQILVQKQESFLNEENSNIRTCQDDDSISPMMIFRKFSY